MDPKAVDLLFNQAITDLKEDSLKVDDELKEKLEQCQDKPKDVS